ncbi:MAG: hypothetical protein KDA59_04090 [Planctomycetales bacterium]|nr:hypothetical protein [Planctomycetales bacterium]MCA9202195.1 hypothetical protein [Planctomycetales bacterium]
MPPADPLRSAETNPYQAPESDTRTEPTTHSTRQIASWKNVGFVFACAAVCAALGSVIGATLGAVAPQYYESVLAGASNPGFNPIAAGFGLGLSQGMLAGLGIGVALVALQCWYDLKSDRQHRG